MAEAPAPLPAGVAADVPDDEIYHVSFDGQSLGMRLKLIHGKILVCFATGVRSSGRVLVNVLVYVCTCMGALRDRIFHGDRRALKEFLCKKIRLTCTRAR